MMKAREDKYKKILDAAIEAFAESGFHLCKVASIARLAGVADGTIYLYFKNKEEILIQLFQERMGEFIAIIRTQLEECSTTSQRLRAIVSTHLTYMQANRSLAIVTQLELRQPNPYLRLAISKPLNEYFNLIETVAKEGIQSGEIPPVSPTIARRLVFGTLDETTTDWLLAPSPRTLVREIEPLVEIFTRALRLPDS